MPKKEFHIVSFSGGKDSTAMLLKMVELDMVIDEIIFCDTGKEFPDLYKHIQKVEKYINRKITVVRGEKTFEENENIRIILNHGSWTLRGRLGLQ